MTKVTKVKKVYKDWRSVKNIPKTSQGQEVSRKVNLKKSSKGYTGPKKVKILKNVMVWKKRKRVKKVKKTRERWKKFTKVTKGCKRLERLERLQRLKRLTKVWKGEKGHTIILKQKSSIFTKITKVKIAERKSGSKSYQGWKRSKALKNGLWKVQQGLKVKRILQRPKKVEKGKSF